MNHFIGKQLFDVRAGASDDAFALTNQLSKLYWQRIVPELERLFDELAGEEEVIRIDRLEIDLGQLSEKQLLEGKFLDDLRRLLAEEISRLMADGKKSLKKAQVGESHFEKWIFFLAHGYFPWDAPQPGKKWLTDVLDTLATEASAVEELRRLALASHEARERLALQHSRNFLKTLAELYTGIRQDGLPEAVQEFYSLEKSGLLPTPKGLLARITARKLELYFWDRILARLMQSREKPDSLELVRWFLLNHFRPSALSALTEEATAGQSPALFRALEGREPAARPPHPELPTGKKPKAKKEEEEPVREREAGEKKIPEPERKAAAIEKEKQEVKAREKQEKERDGLQLEEKKKDSARPEEEEPLAKRKEEGRIDEKPEWQAEAGSEEKRRRKQAPEAEEEAAVPEGRKPEDRPEPKARERKATDREDEQEPPAGKSQPPEDGPDSLQAKEEKAESPQEAPSGQMEETSEMEAAKPKEKEAAEKAGEKLPETTSEADFSEETARSKAAPEEKEERKVSKKEKEAEEPSVERTPGGEPPAETPPEPTKEKSRKEEVPAVEEDGVEEEETPALQASAAEKETAEREKADQPPAGEAEEAIPESREAAPEVEEKEPSPLRPEEIEETPTAKPSEEEPTLSETTARVEDAAGASPEEIQENKAVPEPLAEEPVDAEPETGPAQKTEEPAGRESQEEASPEETAEEPAPEALPSYLQEDKEPPYRTLKEGEAVYLENAGLVLVHPFLATYFGKAGLLKDKKFENETARRRAVHLLHFLAVGEEEMPEYSLALPKVMCGLSPNAPVDVAVELSGEEKEEGIAMLEALIAYWEALRSTSPDGLREGFLQREGKLTFSPAGWELSVEQKALDIMLDRLPWGINVIKLPWMKDMLKVQWR